MSVIRVNKTEDYTVMSNYHFKDKRLSLKAKGLLSQMLSLPDTWDYTVAGLASINKESTSAIKSALNELKENGYLLVTKRMPNETTSGHIEYEYDIFEHPQELENESLHEEIQGIENLYVENQGIENLYVENQVVEKHTQLNTKESSTKELSTKESSTKEKSATRVPSRAKKEHPPIEEQIQAFTDDEELQDALRDFVEFRKSIKKKLNNNAFRLQLKRLSDLSSVTSEQIEIIETAIMSGWQKFYPINDNRARGQSWSKQPRQALAPEEYSEPDDFYR